MYRISFIKSEIELAYGNCDNLGKVYGYVAIKDNKVFQKL